MSFQMYVHTVDTKGKLQSSVAPSSGQDLTTKTYVDEAIAAGGGDWLASVISQLSAQPSTPSTGDRYLIGSGATGSAWAGKEDSVAEWNGTSWDLTDPSEGMHVFIEGGSGALGADIVAVYSGSAWVKGASLNGALVKTNNLSDVSSAGSARANLGLGSLSTASSVNLGTQVSGTLAVTAGGSGATSAADARTNFGLGTAAVEDKASARSDSGKLPALGTISGSPTAVTVDGGGAIVAASLGTAATATIATSLSSSGGNLLKVGSSNLASGDLLKIDANGVIVAGSAGSGTVTSITPEADNGAGTAITSSGSIKIQGDGLAVSTSVSGTDITISASDASTGAKGVAQFTSGEFSVSSGTVSVGNIPVAKGGTGASTATGARSALGVAIGSNVQAYNLALSQIANLSPSTNDMLLYSSGLWENKSGSDLRTALGLTIGTDVQAFNSGLADIAGLSPSSSQIIQWDGGNWKAETLSVSTSDVSGYGEFSNPIKVDASVQSPSGSGVTISPSSVDGAAELYVLDLSGAGSNVSTFTLPAPASGDVGKSITIKVMGSMGSTNKLTVNAPSGDKFDGLSSIELDQDYQRLTFSVMKVAAGTGIDCYALG